MEGLGKVASATNSVTDTDNKPIESKPLTDGTSPNATGQSELELKTMESETDNTRTDCSNTSSMDLNESSIEPPPKSSTRIKDDETDKSACSLVPSTTENATAHSDVASIDTGDSVIAASSVEQENSVIKSPMSAIQATLSDASSMDTDDDLALQAALELSKKPLDFVVVLPSDVVQICWGNASGVSERALCEIQNRWQQGFKFGSLQEPTALTQDSGGPCGVIAPVQAQLLKRLICGPTPSGGGNWRQPSDVTSVLVESLADIIEKCVVSESTGTQDDGAKPMVCELLRTRIQSQFRYEAHSNSTGSVFRCFLRPCC